MEIEIMPDGDVYADVPVLWRQDGGHLEPGTLTLYTARGGPIRHGDTNALITTDKGGPLRGWGSHDCEVSAVVTADGCAWECRLNLETWRAAVLRLANA